MKTYAQILTEAANLAEESSSFYNKDLSVCITDAAKHFKVERKAVAREISSRQFIKQRMQANDLTRKQNRV
jgi:predicted DNA-binding protein YlxM (UPF0122 family)